MAKRFDPILAAITLIAAIAGAVMVSHARNWGLMTDELLYTDMARAIAGLGLPLPRARGEAIYVYQVMLPTLIAPIVGLFSMPDAYPIVAVLNAVIMATAAIPVYLLANYASGSRTAARWVAACAVALPWLSLASKILPDAMAYTALMWAAYTIARTAGKDRPAHGDLWVLLAIVATYLVRNQFIVLVGVWVGVIALRRLAEVLAEGGRLRELWRAAWRLPIERWLPFVTFVIVALIVLIKPLWLLGLYTPTTSGDTGDVAPSGLLHAMLTHVSVVAVAIAGLPLIFALPWLVNALFRGREPAENQSALLIGVLSLVLVFIGASFDQRFALTDRVIERYVFYIAPLILVGAACFFTRPPQHLVLFAAPAIAALLWLNVTEPYGLDALVNFNINHVFSPGQIALIPLQQVADFVGTSIFGLFTVLAIIAGGASWVAIEKGRATLALNAVFALLLATLCVMTVYTVDKSVAYQNDVVDRLLGERDGEQKTWVDNAVGDGHAAIYSAPVADVGAAKRPKNAVPQVMRWWDLEFWNSRLTSYYTSLGLLPNANNPVFAPINKLQPDWETGRIELRPEDSATHLVVAEKDPTLQPLPATGTEPVLRDSFALYALGDDPRVAWATQGLTFSGFVPPEGATLRVYGPRTGKAQGRVTLFMGSNKLAGLEGFEVQGALPVVRGAGRRRDYMWAAENLSAGEHADFKLVRGRGAAHVNRISVSYRPLD